MGHSFFTLKENCFGQHTQQKNVDTGGGDSSTFFIHDDHWVVPTIQVHFFDQWIIVQSFFIQWLTLRQMEIDA